MKGNFFAELKRRNVYKVAVAYAIVGWLLVQVATQVFPFLEIPNWVVRLVIVLVAIGFPIALVIAWAFELTPEGIKRTEDVDLAASARQPRKRAWIFVVIVGTAFSIGLFFIGRYTGSRTAEDGRPPATAGSLPTGEINRAGESESRRDASVFAAASFAHARAQFPDCCHKRKLKRRADLHRRARGVTAFAHNC